MESWLARTAADRQVDFFHKNRVEGDEGGVAESSVIYSGSGEGSGGWGGSIVALYRM